MEVISMKINKTKRFYIFLSLICAVGVFFLSSVFQDMAYWGEGMTWYWIGVVFTYFIWLLGVIFIVLAIKSKGDDEEKIVFNLTIMEIGLALVLICGFCWTTFVIIAGLSVI